MSDPVRQSTGQGGNSTIVVFALDEPSYALSTACVERVLPAMAMLPLPGAPDIVLGIVNVHGDILPVMDVRRRFGLPSREPDVDDLFLVVRTALRRLVFPVTSVTDVRALGPENAVDASEAMPFEAYLSGIVRCGDDIVLIHDVDAFLSLDEESVLNEALHGAAS